MVSYCDCFADRDTGSSLSAGDFSLDALNNRLKRVWVQDGTYIETDRSHANYDDGSDTTVRYRDYWLFLYLCNGINVADFVKLRYRGIVNGEICFARQKTERTTKTRKDLQATGGSGKIKRIDVEKNIEKLKKSIKILR